MSSDSTIANLDISFKAGPIRIAKLANEMSGIVEILPLS
jgi:hypothetical protein